MDYRNTLMWKELNEAPALLQMIAEKNAPVLERIVSEVERNKVDFAYTVARGTSDHAMLYFKYLAESVLGLPTASGAPSTVTLYGTNLRLQSALVVACSQSGRAEDVIEVVKRGRLCGAVTVAITNDEASPLAQIAEFHLCCFTGDEKSVAATKTFTAQLFLSLLLVRMLGKRSCNAAKRLGAGLIYGLGQIDKATDFMSTDFISAEECFILSRGVSSALAFECALKLQETCYIKARAYHSSDFYHGPMAMVGNDTKVILFASRRTLQGASETVHREDCIKCARKMQELGANLYIVTDDASLSCEKANIVLLPGGEDEGETAFYFALAAQMLACKVSCGKGLNPDSPRALKKITITR